MEKLDKNKVRMPIKLPFNAFIDPNSDSEIISSKTFKHGDWNDQCRMAPKFEGVQKRVFPLDFTEFCMLVLTNVAARTKVPKHAHKEAIFRYVVSGSFTLNGKFYQQGDWIYIPEGVPYEIETIEGYDVIAGYRMECDPVEPPHIVNPGDVVNPGGGMTPK